MLDFQLFLVKAFVPAQLSLLEKQPSGREVLRQAIESMPSGESRRGLVWHIGNVEPIDGTGLYLRLGRTKTITIGRHEGGKFHDQRFETAFYTHAIIDLDLAICAIAKKSFLSPSIGGIAREFARLLGSSNKASEFEAKFQLNQIADTTEFIDHLKTAHSVSRFGFLFSSSNSVANNGGLFDLTQRLVRDSNSHQGRTEFRGQNLNLNVLHNAAQSAAFTGNEVVAWLKPTQDHRTVKKCLKGNALSIQQRCVDDLESRKNLLEKVRELCSRSRPRNAA